jgi:hypothetical protein
MMTVEVVLLVNVGAVLSCSSGLLLVVDFFVESDSWRSCILKRQVERKEAEKEGGVAVHQIRQGSFQTVIAIHGAMRSCPSLFPGHGLQCQHSFSLCGTLLRKVLSEK